MVNRVRSPLLPRLPGRDLQRHQNELARPSGSDRRSRWSGDDQATRSWRPSTSSPRHPGVGVGPTMRPRRPSRRANFASGFPSPISLRSRLPRYPRGCPIAGNRWSDAPWSKRTEIPTAIARVKSSTVSRPDRRPGRIGGNRRFGRGRARLHDRHPSKRWERYGSVCRVPGLARFHPGRDCVRRVRRDLHETLSVLWPCRKTWRPLLLVKSSSIHCGCGAGHAPGRRIIVLGGPASVSTDVSTRLRLPRPSARATR